MGRTELCATFNPQDDWLFMDADEDHGDLVVVGCAPNCKPCSLASHHAMGVPDDGDRWLGNVTYRPSRDAYGRLHALRSNVPHLFPDELNLERAPCFKNGGLECPASAGTTTCDCDPELDRIYGNAWQEGMPECRDGTSGSQGRTSTLADPTFFTGHDFGIPGTWMFCRREVAADMGQLPVQLAGGRPTLYQAMFARSAICVSNFLVMAIGKQHNNACLAQAPPEFYNNSAARGYWRRFFVSRLNVSLARPQGRHPEGLFPAQDAAFDSQRAAIAFASAHLSLNNMVKLGFDSPNSDLALWQETWAPDADPTVYAALPNCRLRYSGCTVPVDLVIVSAQITLSLVLHKVKHRTNATPRPAGAGDPGPGEYEDQIWASARFHLAVQLGARATPPAECTTTITNPMDASQRLPSVQGDVLEYVDEQGRLFTPPLHAEWWGSRQALSSNQNGKNGIWQDILAGGPGLPMGNLAAYTAVARRLDAEHPLTVYGMPTMHSRTDKIQDYMGSVTVHLNVPE